MKTSPNLIASEGAFELEADRPVMPTIASISSALESCYIGDEPKIGGVI
jgi:hypothetical protein